MVRSIGLAGETPPDLLLCVAYATNLRVALRLVIELKQVGRPLMLVCLDGSELSATIVPAARRLAARLGADVHLARVVDERTVHETVAEALEALAHGFHAEARTVLLHGPSAAEAIVSYACAQDADLIAMATHSRRAVAELIWGSTTAAVVRSGVAPVVVIHPAV